MSALAMRGAAAPAGGEDRARILVVDDRADKCLALEAILADLGQEVVVAGSGEEALRRILANDFAVILLDVNMPGLDGLETAALIRQRRRSAHVPIIFITSDFHDEAHTAKGYALGAVDYIASPVVPEILRAKVRVFVDLFLLARRAERQAQEHLALVEERAARVAAERATLRLAFLAQASSVLAGSLELAATTRELGRLVVPQVADLALLWINGRDGERPRVEMTHEASGRGAVVLAVDEPLEGAVARAVERVGASGLPELIGPSALAAPVRLPGGRMAHTLVAVPLVAHGRTLAVLVLAACEARRTLDGDSLSMARDLASRAAIAIDNAVLYESIQESDQRKNEFIAMLAHELRNPLAPIGNALHVLALEPGNAGWASEIIGRQFRQLTRLVDDLLDLSRITRGKIELKLETLDVAAVVAAAIETSRPLVEAHRHALDVALPAEPLHVRGDFARLAQVVANLVNNAAKYTEPEGRIDVHVGCEGDEVVLRVRDTGVGIPPQYQARIFEPFLQVDRTLDRSQGGLGIGLTLVRRLVDMQGGRVEVYSEGDGKGSLFTVRLPRAAPPAEERGTRAGHARGPQALAGLCVLVVDDNRDVAQSTAIVLGASGCRVQLAHDGPDALAALDALRPDAVLLDIGLPGMNGYDVAKAIRTRDDHQGVMIVAVSGYGQEEYKARSRDAGFDHHLVKPIDPAVVLRLLGDHLQKRNAGEVARSALPSNVVSLRANGTA